MAPRLLTTELADLLPMKRTSGRHVSQAIYRLAVKLGHLEERSDDNGPQMAYLQLGCTWEDVMAEALAKRVALHEPGRYIHGMEMYLDGLYGTLDILDVADSVVEECKLTKISSRNDIRSDKFWKWWVQVKAYCWMAGVNTGRLRVAFLNGDYAWMRGEKDNDLIHYRVWEDTWTSRELQNNWKMICNAARELPPEVHP